MMKANKLIIAVAALGMAFSALALTLDSAKEQGLVGETESGYLAAVNGNAQVQALISDINAKRKAKYQQLAQKNGISLSQVEALAGKKAIEKTSTGHYVQVNGRWVKK
ncbi:YdbL family protein [Pseudoalteromonas sp. JBTF-M23]|uniref:YdbL family protein n=2 Tax=Pseudoalteromonas caenipelagi TaxID=2726988 RepID=A0A849VI52_9GAMM|nr:YdbL family protein [Pseudoalteromonas caenipelagi]NOU52368.1 YdbL family protein [Pseudoalteromonas caenipelagi]